MFVMPLTHRLRLRRRWQRLFRAGLADLLLEFLALVANTLLLVRIRLAQSAHFGCNLSDLLAVDAGDRDGRLLRIDGHSDSGRKRVFDRVRVAEREDHDVLRLDFSAVSDADDVELTRPAIRHAFDGVRHQRTGQSVHSGLLIALAMNDEVAFFLLERNALRKMVGDGAFRALHDYVAALDREGNTLRHRDRFLTNS